MHPHVSRAPARRAPPTAPNRANCGVGLLTGWGSVRVLSLSVGSRFTTARLKAQRQMPRQQRAVGWCGCHGRWPCTQMSVRRRPVTSARAGIIWIRDLPDPSIMDYPDYIIFCINMYYLLSDPDTCIQKFQTRTCARAYCDTRCIL